MKYVICLAVILGGCLAGGCATKVTSIGEVSERPILELDLPGMSLKVHSLAATFEHGETETP